MTLNIHPLGNGFAAEIRGIDVTTEKDGDLIDRLGEVIDRWSVVILPGQHLDNDAQIAFAARFGPIEMSANHYRQDYKSRLGRPELSDVSNLDEKNKVRKSTDRMRMTMLGNQLWHTDSSFKRVPAALSMLYAHAVPQKGGETQFADLRAAYDALEPDMQTRLSDLACEHSLMRSRALIGFDDFTPEELLAMPPVPHRLVRTHPRSGRKTLFLASHASHVIGWPVPEGRMLIYDLMEHATQPQFVHTHHWRPGDLVIWDNRCTMHRGRPYDEREARDLRRVTTSDELTTFEREPIEA